MIPEIPQTHELAAAYVAGWNEVVEQIRTRPDPAHGVKGLGENLQFVVDTVPDLPPHVRSYYDGAILATRHFRQTGEIEPLAPSGVTPKRPDLILDMNKTIVLPLSHTHPLPPMRSQEEIIKAHDLLRQLVLLSELAGPLETYRTIMYVLCWVLNHDSPLEQLLTDLKQSLRFAGFETKER